MRPEIVGFFFLSSAVVSFNAGIWQIYRRKEKRQLMENHKNIFKPPMKELPLDNSNLNEHEFRTVILDGTLDNEGSMLVGPRAIPSYKGAAHADESKGGFFVFTPFEIAGDGQFVMVNRGWVPIDAGKRRIMLTQYIGEGFAQQTVKGIIRREEYMSRSAVFGESPDNAAAVVADLSWLAIRPWNMLLEYYKKRYGAEHADETAKKHGLHHFYLEMVEDYSGDDQRIVRDHVWPRRRDEDEIMYVHLTPIVHTMYVFFWFTVTLGSLYGMSKCWQRQKQMVALRKYATNQSILLERKRQEEAQAFFAASKEVEKMKLAEQTRRTTQIGAKDAYTPPNAGGAASKPTGGSVPPAAEGGAGASSSEPKP